MMDTNQEIIYGIIVVIILLVLYNINIDTDDSNNIFGENFSENFSENFDQSESDAMSDRITHTDKKRYRKIVLADTKFYFLTMDNPKRKNHMLNEFKEYSPIEVNPVTGIPRYMSGATGFGRMIDKGLRDQDRSKPFQPFIIMEDDASKMREFPKTIRIPEDADIVYLGLHSWGYSKTEPVRTIYSEDYDKDLIKVKNLLALHGVMVCSAAGASVIQRSMVESYYRDKAWDVPITHAQPFYNVYALKKPLVYQDKKYGGKESVTKIYPKKHWFRPMPKSYVNHEGVTNLMVQY
jgi:hypothetical protein